MPEPKKSWLRRNLVEVILGFITGFILIPWLTGRYGRPVEHAVWIGALIAALFVAARSIYWRRRRAAARREAARLENMLLIQRLEDQRDRLQAVSDRAKQRINWAEAELRDLRHKTAQGVDPALRVLLARLDRAMGEDLCFIGPNGCQTHFGETDCTIAWIRSWLHADGPLPTTGANLALMVQDDETVAPLIAEALEHWATSIEPTVAGATGGTGQTMRSKLRRATEIVHVCRGDL